MACQGLEIDGLRIRVGRLLIVFCREGGGISREFLSLGSIPPGAGEDCSLDSASRYSLRFRTDILAKVDDKNCEIVKEDVRGLLD